MNSQRRMKIISVDGSVGVGKSTLLQLCQEFVDDEGLESKICIIPEPVEIWERFLDSAPQGRRQFSALQLFYQHPDELSYPFQIFVLITLQHHLDQKTFEHEQRYGEPPALVICERCQNWAARETFIANFQQSGRWSQNQCDFYETTWSYVVRSAGYEPPLHWYITCSPETSLHRVQHRARPGEQRVSLDFLLRLHNHFQRWHRLQDGQDVVLSTEMDITSENHQHWYRAWVTKHILDVLFAERLLTVHNCVRLHEFDQLRLRADLFLTSAPILL